MNDNFMKCVRRSIYIRELREVLHDLLRDVQDATHYQTDMHLGRPSFLKIRWASNTHFSRTLNRSV